jgi:disulfide bond formation protein DsbB
MRGRHVWDVVQVLSMVLVALIAVAERERWAILIVAIAGVLGVAVSISHRWFWEGIGGWWLRVDPGRKYTEPPKPMQMLLRRLLRGRTT